jgi:hypothetical protein
MHLLTPVQDTQADCHIAMSERVIAAEEVGALLRKPDPQSGFMERAIAAMRGRLWENIACFENIKLSEGEIINNYVIPAVVRSAETC